MKLLKVFRTNKDKGWSIDSVGGSRGSIEECPHGWFSRFILRRKPR